MNDNKGDAKIEAKHKGWCPDRIIAETATTCPCNVGGNGNVVFGESRK